MINGVRACWWYLLPILEYIDKSSANDNLTKNIKKESPLSDS